MKVVAVIPAYDEENSIGEVVRGCRKFVDEVIVVDDGSKDRTGEIAKGEGAIVIRHHRNLGVGAAVSSGYEVALRRRAEIVVQLDGDGQHDPSEIPKLIEPIEMGEADLVIGSRFIGSKFRFGMKYLGNIFFTKMVNLLTGLNLTDAQSGFRAIKADVLRGIMVHSPFTYTQESLIRAYKEGFRIKEVPINVRERKYGKSKVVRNPLIYGIKTLIILSRVVRDYHPLLFFGAMGLVSLCIGCLLGLYIIFYVLEKGTVGAYPRVILASLLILVGLQILFLGMLADMISSLRGEMRTLIKRLEVNSE